MTATPQDKAISKARNRNLTAAKRSLKLIADGVRLHQADLEAGRVPEAGFLISAQKYEQARAALELLDMISTAKVSDEDLELPEVVREDLTAVIELVRQFKLVPEEAWNGNTVLTRLDQLSSAPPWNPRGPRAPVAPSEREPYPPLDGDEDV